MHAFFDGRSGPPRWAPADPVLVAKTDEQRLRINELEGRMPQLHHAGKLGQPGVAAGRTTPTASKPATAPKCMLPVPFQI